MKEKLIDRMGCNVIIPNNVIYITDCLCDGPLPDVICLVQLCVE